jgi:hypothetical protein
VRNALSGKPGRFIYSCILGKREIYEQPGNNVLVTAYFMTGYERTDDIHVTRWAAVPLSCRINSSLLLWAVAVSGF